jgi:hypothetical protein
MTLTEFDSDQSKRVLSWTSAGKLLLAGRAVVTVQSVVDDSRFTYRIERKTALDGTPVDFWFVSVLVGPDNTANYAYLPRGHRRQARSPRPANYRADRPEREGLG